MPLIDAQLARFVHGLYFPDLPGGAAERAKVPVFDTIAIAVARSSVTYHSAALRVIKNNRGGVAVIGRGVTLHHAPPVRHEVNAGLLPKEGSG
jgi:2-methylcitrate dehydratase PrpD